MKRLLKLNLITIIVMLFSLNTHAATITFDTTPATNNPVIGTHVEAGFYVTSSHAHITGNTSCGLTDCVSSNADQYISSEMGAQGSQYKGESIIITHSSNAGFDLVKFYGGEQFINDADAVTGGYPNADSIQVVGTKIGGGSMTINLVLDGAKDGPGGINDLQLFTTLSGFTDLISVTFTGLSSSSPSSFGAFSLDTIEVSAVPEPETVMLFLFGLCSLALIRRRKIKNELTA